MVRMPNTTHTKTIVLVHGAFADHHAFDAVAPLFAQRGFTVVANDLAGHGADATPLASISLDRYVDDVARVVRDSGPVVLVGHSMAGMIVSQVAERVPDAVDALIYVAAYLPEDGQSLQALAETDGDSLVGKNMEFAPDYSTVSIKPSAIGDAICADLPADVQKMIAASQRPEPLSPFQGKVALTAGAFGRVKKAYLQTTADRAVTPALQQRMLQKYPSMPVDALATSHLPFVAQPAAFVDKVLSLVERAR